MTPRRAGHPLLWVAGLVLLVVVAGIVARLTDGDPAPRASSGPEASSGRDASSTPGDDAPAAAPRPAPAADRATLAADVLRRLADALRERSRTEAAALAAPADDAAVRQLGYLVHNVRALHVADLGFRYLGDDDASSLTGAVGAPAVWTGDVRVSWRIRGYDEGRSSLEVPFTFRRTDERAAFVSAGRAGGERSPLWLLEPLRVARTRTALVMVAGRQQEGGLLAMAGEARSAVRDVLPRWRGRVVVEVPRSEEQLDRLLGSEPGTYGAIAAVTSTADGSLSSSAPTHVFVNPDVFGRLGDNGSQIVLTHEVTHVATGAATADTPMWLLEGFADYVALSDVDLPVSVTAGRILHRVAEHGPPRRLPRAADFGPQRAALGTTYEAAWLACRLLARTYGEEELVDFYNASVSRKTAAEAFRELGTTRAGFTAAWRSYLRRLAG